MPLTGAAPTETVVDLEAFGPTPLEHMMVKVVVVLRVPVVLLPLVAGVAAPTLGSIEQVMVPPPVTPLQFSVVLCPSVMLEEVGVNEPIATLARHAVPFHVEPVAQEAVMVSVSNIVPLPFLRSKTVCGLATYTVRPGELFAGGLSIELTFLSKR